MTKTTLTLAVLLFLFGMNMPALAQKAFSPQPSVKLPTELDRVLRDYEQAWKNNKPGELALLFTDQGYVPSDAGWIMGHEAIQNKYKETGGDLRLRAIDYAMERGVGFIVGAYGYGEKAADLDMGNFILALRKTDAGKWLIVADLDKGNQH